ncbi:MAG: N-acetyltransferase [Pedobacter sp.]|nr:MAG: N-acetyltransferase [Pedobacter sp.]
MLKLKLHTPRITIRNMQPGDLEGFLFYRQNPDIVKYQSFGVMTRERAIGFISAQQEKVFGVPGEWVQYAVELNGGAEVIGDCAVQLDCEDPRIARVGITISHTHQCKGYAREVFKAILEFLFDQVNVHRVEETVDTRNIASITLLKKMEFRMEGHFIENIFDEGHWISEYQYAMLKREWDVVKGRI